MGGAFNGRGPSPARVQDKADACKNTAARHSARGNAAPVL